MYARQARWLRTALHLSRSEADIQNVLDAAGGILGLVRSRGVGLEPLLDKAGRARWAGFLRLMDVLAQGERAAPRMESPEEVAKYFMPRLRWAVTESFWVMGLDSRLRVLSVSCVSRGTVDACLVHPREVFAPVIQARAASLIVVHNHPSGDPTPSQDDQEVTDQLSRAGALLGIPVLDHIVIAQGGFRSIRPSDALKPFSVGRW
jgi:DNA repair protein RadC